MACCARVEHGTVKVSLTPEPGSGRATDARPTRFDPSIVSVVVLGNGIAGVTAADYVRRGHPDCEIHIVGREAHVLYNRMGISRLIYGRSAMQGLYLLGEQWYDEHGITAWLNTLATRIDVDSHRVLLGTGDYLPFDRLIFAMGSRSFVPLVEGFGRPGTFVLREAIDAMQIRAYAQEHGCRQAVVAGGGLLGLEAAHSLHELGMRVTVLERGQRLLARHIDHRCSELVEAHFANLGMDIHCRAETKSINGDDRVTGVTLNSGADLPCDLFLACVGIQPNTDLARTAGIAVNRGVLVDDRMATNIPGIFAAGDVAEHNGQVVGLWPIAAKQAEIAAINALGGDETLASEVPAVILKGVGLDLTAVGRFEPNGDDDVIVLEHSASPSYRRLVISEGKAVGTVILGHHPEDAAAATAAVKRQAEIPPAARDTIRNGAWRVLKDAGRRVAPPVEI
jgi:NAD(P)H-nitrite reductase large subunit